MVLIRVIKQTKNSIRASTGAWSPIFHCRCIALFLLLMEMVATSLGQENKTSAGTPTSLQPTSPPSQHSVHLFTQSFQLSVDPSASSGAITTPPSSWRTPLPTSPPPTDDLIGNQQNDLPLDDTGRPADDLGGIRRSRTVFPLSELPDTLVIDTTANNTDNNNNHSPTQNQFFFTTHSFKTPAGHHIINNNSGDQQDVSNRTIVTARHKTKKNKRLLQLSTQSPTIGLVNFSVKPHPIRPFNALLVTFTDPNGEFKEYRLNYSDLSRSSSFLLPSPIPSENQNIVFTKSPYTLLNLLPGHTYQINIVGIRRQRILVNGQSPDQQQLYSNTVTTFPKAPKFPKSGVRATERSISLNGSKSPPNSLQDSFTISTQSLDAGDVPTAIQVDDLPNSDTVEFYASNLQPGVTYNVTVTANQNLTTSTPWHGIVTTKPLPPANVEIEWIQSNSIGLRWDPPQGSGYDSFIVKYGPEVESEHETVLDDIRSTQINISEHLRPGEKFTFRVSAVKSEVSGTAYNRTVIMLPLEPKSMEIKPDLSKQVFNVELELPGFNETLFDRCHLNYVREDYPPRQSEPISEAIKSAEGTTDSPPYCNFELNDLVPGSAYEFSAWTSRRGTESKKLRLRKTIRPAFDRRLLNILPQAKQQSVSVIWSSYNTADWNPILSRWREMIGVNANLTGRLDGPGLDTSLIESGSPLLNPKQEAMTFRDPNMSAGACYEIQLYTAAQGIISSNKWETRIRTEPPKAEMIITSVSKDQVNILVKIESGVRVDNSCSFNISLGDHKQTQSDNATIREQEVIFRDLHPYSNYQFTGEISCRSKNKLDDKCSEKSRPLGTFNFTTDQAKPDAPDRVNVTLLEPYEVSVEWSPPPNPNGIIKGYRVTVTPENHQDQEMSHEVSATDRTRLTVSDLIGGARYKFKVAARTDAGYGQMATGTIAKEDNTSAAKSTLPPGKGARRRENYIRMPIKAPPVPKGQVEILTNSVRSTDFMVRFNSSMMSSKNGPIRKYAIIVADVDSDQLPDAQRPNLSWHQVRNRRPWLPYIAVQDVMDLTTTSQDSSSSSKVITKKIGIDTECVSKTEAYERDSYFCNGPLRSGGSYRVALRAYTDDNLYTDSQFSSVVKTAMESSNAGKSIIAVIVSVLIVLAIAVTILVFLRRKNKFPKLCPSGGVKVSKASEDWIPRLRNTLTRNHNNSHNNSHNGNVNMNHNVNNGNIGNNINNHNEIPTVYDPRIRQGVDRPDKLSPGRYNLPPIPTVISNANVERSRMVAVPEFGQHVRLMSADSDFRFSEEFEDFKQIGRGIPSTAADLPVNRNKNRFTNILPFDHSRVKLISIDDEEGSDFINANYIPGANSKREFIAAQGPLPSTRDDFWRMVWEQQCPSVINLTRCIEKGREKCDQYWPLDSQPATYGDIELSLMNETRTPDWTLREFRMTDLTEYPTNARSLKHFHFHAWPDFGVPEKPQSLIQFVRAFRQKVPPDSACKPTIVHCSAGVGRSGTFIALDRLIQLVERGAQTVDIFAIVSEMRKERIHMVQTEQQYICIHQCLLCVLDGRENEQVMSARENYPLPVPTPVITVPTNPRIGVEIHQNPAFEDDEGIAESGV